MHIIIIGNGIAGQTAADRIRKNDSTAAITIITKEHYPYYTRIHLPAYIAEEKTRENLIIRKLSWFEQKNIHIRLDTEVTEINPTAHTILVSDLNQNYETLSYDRLIMATGSNARRISLTGETPQMQGIFTLRNFKDADAIKQFITANHVQDVFIMGGGLLGIELGFHLRALQLHVSICEISPYLLPRQLDEGTSRLLQTYLEEKGLSIVCGEMVEKVIGNSHIQTVQFKSGKQVKTQLMLQQLGIIPAITLAKSSGLKVDRGIIVNEYLQTSHSDIYAVGDCVQFQGRIMGIIPACLDQAKIAALHLLEKSPLPYQGTIWNTKLKIAGLSLSCIGDKPEESDRVLQNVDKDTYMCRKVLIEDNVLKGAILMGEGSDRYYRKNLNSEIDLDELKEHLDHL
ncbi:MAG: NAD(P)/FAD-dependent oxidoreductase [Promethearchaeota archaeon]